MSLNELEDGMVGIASNPIAAGVVGAIGGAVIGGVATAAVLGSSKRSKSRTARKRGNKSRDRRFISKQKWEKAYQKRRRKLGKKTYGKHYKTKKHSKKGVHYTKKGQPYIILKSGKARFVKK